MISAAARPTGPEPHALVANVAVNTGAAGYALLFSLGERRAKLVKLRVHAPLRTTKVASRHVLSISVERTVELKVLTHPFLARRGVPESSLVYLTLRRPVGSALCWCDRKYRYGQTRADASDIAPITPITPITPIPMTTAAAIGLIVFVLIFISISDSCPWAKRTNRACVAPTNVIRISRSAFNTVSDGTVVRGWRDIWVGASVVDHHALARLQGSSRGPALRLVSKIKERCVGRDPAGHRTAEDHSHQYQGPHVFAPELTQQRPSDRHSFPTRLWRSCKRDVVRNCAADPIAAARPPRALTRHLVSVLRRCFTGGKVLLADPAGSPGGLRTR
jgi:hypothetical protein